MKYVSSNSDETQNKVIHLLISNKALITIISFGILLRTMQFLDNRSLWVDEAELVLKMSKISFFELFHPSINNIATPIGFLALEKLAVQAFSLSEYSLRLLPLLSGIFSLFLFAKALKHFNNLIAVPIALGLFSLSAPLIYYSSEFKQYSSDVAITLALYLITFHILKRGLSFHRIILFGILGAIAIWFSHPAVLILAGIGIGLSLFYFIKKQWNKIGRLCIAYSFWAISFGLLYFLFLESHSTLEHLQQFFSSSFMPFPPSSISDLVWFIKRTANLGSFFWTYGSISFILNIKPAVLLLFFITFLTFLAGFFSFMRNKKRSFYILVFPIFFTLIASGLQKYPMRGRLLLFLVPTAIIFIAEGAEWIRDKTWHRSRIIGLMILCLLFIYPLFSVSYHLVRPRTHEEIKPVMRYIKNNKMENDVLYLYYGAENAFKCYSEKYGFNDEDYIVGIKSRDDFELYKVELDKLIGNERVWIVFSHVYKRNGVDEEKFFLSCLDRIGIQIDSYKDTGAAVYLYELIFDIKLIKDDKNKELNEMEGINNTRLLTAKHDIEY